MQSFDSNMQSFDSNMQSFDSNMQSFDSNMQSFDSNMQSFDSNMQSFDSNMQSFIQTCNLSIQTCNPLFKHAIFRFKHSNLPSNMQSFDSNMQSFIQTCNPLFKHAILYSNMQSFISTCNPSIQTFTPSIQTFTPSFEHAILRFRRPAFDSNVCRSLVSRSAKTAVLSLGPAWLKMADVEDGSQTAAECLALRAHSLARQFGRIIDDGSEPDLQTLDYFQYQIDRLYHHSAPFFPVDECGDTVPQIISKLTEVYKIIADKMENFEKSTNYQANRNCTGNPGRPKLDIFCSTAGILYRKLIQCC